MKNKFIRSICMALSILMACAALSGCASRQNEEQEQKKETRVIEPMEAEEVNNLTFDITGGKDVMPISGYYGPYVNTYCRDGETPPDMITDEYWKMMADCGINLINYTQTSYNSAPDMVRKMLELGGTYGVGLIVTDEPLRKGSLLDEEASARINEYGNYPAFCGVHVIDEPNWPGYAPGDGTRDIEDFAPAFAQLDKLGVVAVSNLLPTYASAKTEDYPKYVEEFLSTCPTPYLSFDHYVFDKGRDISEYFYNLSVIREKAQEYNIPFWTFIQAGSQWNDSRGRFDSTTPYYPNEKQFDWNINTSLAYGAQGIEYFPLVQPEHFSFAESKPYDFERNGILGTWGNKTQWYYYAQNINKHLYAIDEVLMNSKNKGVIVNGEQAVNETARSSCILEGTSWRELEDVSGDTMVGCFNYQGRTALYVVNYDMEYAQDIKLTFYDECRFCVIQNAEKAYYSGSEIVLSMQAGEGVLIVFE